MMSKFLRGTGTFGWLLLAVICWFQPTHPIFVSIAAINTAWVTWSRLKDSE